MLLAKRPAAARSVKAAAGVHSRDSLATRRGSGTGCGSAGRGAGGAGEAAMRRDPSGVRGAGAGADSPRLGRLGGGSEGPVSGTTAGVGSSIFESALGELALGESLPGDSAFGSSAAGGLEIDGLEKGQPPIPRPA